MLRNQILPLIFVLAVSFAGCGRAAEAARVELAQMNVPYTEAAYIESARQGDTATLTLFLKAGVNPEAKTYDGQSALLVATLANQAGAVKLLLAKGAGPNAQDKHGGTALMTAAWRGNKEIIEVLLANGADVNKQANNGMTALMFAAWENRLEISRVLLEKGADLGLKELRINLSVRLPCWFRRRRRLRMAALEETRYSATENSWVSETGLRTRLRLPLILTSGPSTRLCWWKRRIRGLSFTTTRLRP